MSKGKVYVAAPFEMHATAREAMTALEKAGCEITHDWTQEAKTYPDGNAPPKVRAEHAQQDLDGVRAADVVLVLTSEDRTKGCGMWAELGIAVAIGKQVVVSGPQCSRCIFTSLDPKRFSLRQYHSGGIDEAAFRATRIAEIRDRFPADGKPNTFDPPLAALKTPPAGEVRVTDPKTGGQKGIKPERYDLIPWEAVDEIARVFGFGAQKYPPWNWLKGYAWGLSYGAMMRHATQWLSGHSKDPESGLSHLAHVAWHALVLMTYEKRGIGTDDRPAALTG